MNIPDNTPIITGTGQKTWHAIDATRTPVDALYEAGAAAIADAGNSRLVNAIDAVVMVRFIADTKPGISALFVNLTRYHGVLAPTSVTPL